MAKTNVSGIASIRTRDNEDYKPMEVRSVLRWISADGSERRVCVDETWWSAGGPDALAVEGLDRSVLKGLRLGQSKIELDAALAERLEAFRLSNPKAFVEAEAQGAAEWLRHTAACGGAAVLAAAEAWDAFFPNACVGQDYDPQWRTSYPGERLAEAVGKLLASGRSVPDSVKAAAPELLASICSDYAAKARKAADDAAAKARTIDTALA